jgi:predicted kinase
MPKLTIIRGLPGSGKSTHAKSLGCFFVETDMYYMRDGIYEWTQEKVTPSHHWCYNTIKSAMNSGIDIVVSNVYTKVSHFSGLIDMANTMGYTVTVLRCMDDFGSIHIVPQVTLDRMKNRFQDYDNEIIIRKQER